MDAANAMFADYPPRSYGTQGHPVCPKCGEDFHTRRDYRVERRRFWSRKITPEHFVCNCPCGYVWREAVEGGR